MLVETGKIIKTYLESNNKTFDDLIKACSLSSRTLYRALNSENKLSYEIAVGVNKLIPEITPEFLLAYDGKYQAQKKQMEHDNGIKDINNVIKVYKVNKLYPELKDSKEDLINKAIDVFGLDNIRNNTINNSKWVYSYNFSQAKNANEFNKDLWLSSIYYDYCLVNKKTLLNENLINEAINDIKNYCGTKDYKLTIFNMNEICKNYGINYYFKSSIPNSRIKAVTIKDVEGYVYLFISDLFKCVENLWVSFMHEMIHIIDKDYEKSIIFDENDRKTNEAYVSDKVGYYFIGDDYKNISDVTNKYEINEIANKNSIPVGIVAELWRMKTNIYNDKSINSYVHYFK